MKLQPVYLAIIAVSTLVFFTYSSAFSMDTPGFVINRMVVCEKITDREPVAISNTFSSDTERIYCFLEAADIAQDTPITFIWYFEKKEMARVSLPLVKGRRWRTYSSKKLAGLKGNWQVELRGSSGAVLNTISFKVQ